MSVFEAMTLMSAFATLVVLILDFNKPKNNRLCTLTGAKRRLSINFRTLSTVFFTVLLKESCSRMALFSFT